VLHKDVIVTLLAVIGSPDNVHFFLHLLQLLLILILHELCLLLLDGLYELSLLLSLLFLLLQILPHLHQVHILQVYQFIHPSLVLGQGRNLIPELLLLDLLLLLLALQPVLQVVNVDLQLLLDTDMSTDVSFIPLHLLFISLQGWLLFTRSN